VDDISIRETETFGNPSFETKKFWKISQGGKNAAGGRALTTAEEETCF